MPEEGTASTATDSGISGGSLAAVDSTSQVEQSATSDDVWSFTDPPSEQVETPAEATPEAEHSTVSTDSQPEVEKTESPTDPLDRVTDPKREDFQAVRQAKRELETKLRESQPLVELAQKIQTTLGDPNAVDIIAPLFQISEPGPQAVETASGFVEKLEAYDPLQAAALREATYGKYADVFFNWALQDKGIDPARWQEFERWQANPQAFAQTAYGPQSFPAPNADGYVTVAGPDGQPLTLDTSDPQQNYLYQMAKKDYEREQADQKAKGETEARSRQEAQYRAESAATQRADGFTSQCDKDLDEAFASLSIDVGATPTKFGGTETDLAKLMTWGIARTWMDRDERHQAAFSQGIEKARRGAQAADSVRLELKRNASNYLTKARDAVKSMFDELQGYRQQAKSGGLTTSPKIPEDAQLITNPVDDSMPQIQPRSNGQADAYSDIWGTVGR